MEIVGNKLRGREDAATRIKNAYGSLSYSFCFSGKSSHTLKPINHFNVYVLTLPLLKQMYVLGSPPSSNYYVLPKRLLPEASHTLFLHACPNQFTKLFSLEPDPEIPSSLPGSLNLKARLISPALLTIYNYNSLCTHLITDAYYFVHKLISCIHVLIQYINYCLCWCVSVLSLNKNYQIKGHVFHLDLAQKMSDARCFLKMISYTLNST